MLKRKVLALAALAVLILASLGFETSDIQFADCSLHPAGAADCSQFAAEGAGKAKNVILMIGDGMGLTQIYAGRVKANGPDQPFAWEQLPHRGLVNTCSVSGITDSAAASTALCTGCKTQNAEVDYDPQGRRLTNIADLIHSRRAVGVVTTVRVWDATPAGVTAHATQRSDARNISAEYVRQMRPEVIMGGGASAFLPDTSLFSNSDLDRADLEAEAKKAGYAVVRTNAEMKALDRNATNRLLGLFAPEDMAYELDRPAVTTEPHLTEMATAALDVLDNDPRGFFLMIEGGAIDHACHKTDIERAIGEVVEFDRAVSAVLAWMQTHPDTLLIITADHETGGMELIPGKYKKGDEINVRWRKAIIPGTATHSDQEVAVFATGPNSAAIKPQMQNTEIFCVIKNAFGPN